MPYPARWTGVWAIELEAADASEVADDLETVVRTGMIFLCLLPSLACATRVIGRCVRDLVGGLTREEGGAGLDVLGSSSGRLRFAVLLAVDVSPASCRTSLVGGGS